MKLTPQTLTILAVLGSIFLGTFLAQPDVVIAPLVKALLVALNALLVGAARLSSPDGSAA